MSTDLDLIRKIIAPTVSEDEFQFFIARCKQSGLDPIARQIYAVSRYDRQAGGNKMTIQVSIDGMRLMAERSGKYAGQLGPEWCGKDGKWVDIWLEDVAPSAARVGVIRSDFASPLYAVAKYTSYVQTGKDNNVYGLWAKMPDLMLAKCAESLALRRAFPAETSGFYTREEMAQADNDLPAQVLIQETTVEEVTDEPASNGHQEPPQDMIEARLAQVKGLYGTMFNSKSWSKFVGRVIGVSAEDNALTIEELDKLFVALMDAKKQAKSA